MKSFPKLYIAMVAAGLCSASMAADDVEELKRELRELRSKTEQLEKKVQQLESGSAQTSAPSVSTPAGTTNITSSIPRMDGSYKTAPGTGAFSLLRGPSGYLNLSLDGLLTV